MTLVDAGAPDGGSDPTQSPKGDVWIRATREGMPAGYMARLLGVSIRDPLQVDRSGKSLQASSSGPAFAALPVTALRHPAGSQSYKIQSTEDASTKYVLETLLPSRPQAAHDWTWPPQLPTNELNKWLTAKTRTISLANEPPIHPEHFETPDAYVVWARGVVDAYPQHRSAFALQTGKPHVANLSPDEKQKQKHLAYLQATGAAVRSGLLPARIYNTTKLYPDFPADLYALFTKEQDDYVATHTSAVQVTYGEWNWAEADNLSPEQIPACAAFLLVLARLRGERGDQVFAANYQQGYAVGTSSIIGLNGPSKQGDWVVTAFTEFWNEFGGVFRDGRYIPSEIARPENVYLELFQTAEGAPIVLYSNRGSVPVSLNLPAATFSYYAGTARTASAPWANSLPALSAGLISLSALP